MHGAAPSGGQPGSPRQVKSLLFVCPVGVGGQAGSRAAEATLQGKGCHLTMLAVNSFSSFLSQGQTEQDIKHPVPRARIQEGGVLAFFSLHVRNSKGSSSRPGYLGKESSGPGQVTYGFC